MDLLIFQNECCKQQRKEFLLTSQFNFFPKKPQQNSQLIIDKITIKLSYSCMANTKQKIDNHNRKIITNGREKEEFTRTCNCRDKTSSVLQGKFLQERGLFKSIVIQKESLKQAT